MTRKQTRRAKKPRRRRVAPLARTTAHKTTYDHKEIRVRHTEFVDSVEVTGGELERLRYEINPGLPRTFDWLSGLAENYETYRIHSLRFRYVPRCSATQGGYIVMAPDFDPADDNSSATRRDLLAFDGAVTSSLWAGVSTVFTGANLHRKDVHYIRTTELTGSLDIKTYDVASLEMMVMGSGSGFLLLGDLFIDYDITLSTPQRSARVIEGMQDMIDFDSVSTSQPFGSDTTFPVGAEARDAGYTNTFGGEVTSTLDGSTWGSLGYSNMVELARPLIGNVHIRHGTISGHALSTGTLIGRLIDKESGDIRALTPDEFSVDSQILNGQVGIDHNVSVNVGAQVLRDFGNAARWAFGYATGSLPSLTSINGNAMDIGQIAFSRAS